MKFKKELKVAKKLALKAGRIMRKYFDDDLQVEIKADNSTVTIADKLINDLVIEKLSKKFPRDGVIGEEKSNSEYGMGRKWLCDPIDGTAGFIWGTPTAMFSLALVIDGEPVLGVAYDPFLKRMYWGIKGEGSFQDGKRLQVSSLDLNQGYVAISGSSRRLRKLPYLEDLVETGARLATFSGAVYKSCLVAKGKMLAYIEHGVNAHDMAATHVMVEEAGGKVTGLDGAKLDYSKPFKDALASNIKVHKKIIEILQNNPKID